MHECVARCSCALQLSQKIWFPFFFSTLTGALAGLKKPRRKRHIRKLSATWRLANTSLFSVCLPFSCVRTIPFEKLEPCECCWPPVVEKKENRCFRLGPTSIDTVSIATNLPVFISMNIPWSLDDVRIQPEGWQGPLWVDGCNARWMTFSPAWVCGCWAALLLRVFRKLGCVSLSRSSGHLVVLRCWKERSYSLTSRFPWRWAQHHHAWVGTSFFILVTSGGSLVRQSSLACLCNWCNGNQSTHVSCKLPVLSVLLPPLSYFILQQCKPCISKYPSSRSKLQKKGLEPAVQSSGP